MLHTLLLVDDNKEILEVLQEELYEKYRVLTALNGQIALGVLQREQVDLVISDVMMPVLDGYELCKLIKSNFDFSHIPVVLLTAKNTLASKITGLENGADAYIEKPFDVDHLIAQIANLLNNRQKLRDYFVKSPLAMPGSMAQSKMDELLMNRLHAIIEQNFGDHDLNVDKLARLMTMSRTSLFRKIKSITELTPNELVNITRLKKAAQLLTTGNYKIYEVSEMVGYSSQTIFGRNFSKQFGITPTEYQKRSANK